MTAQPRAPAACGLTGCIGAWLACSIGRWSLTGPRSRACARAIPVNRLRRPAPARRILTVSRRDGLLTAEQEESLERDGYLMVPSLLDEIVLAPMRSRLDQLLHQ